MTSTQFIDLVRRMRAAQKFYYKLHPVNDREKKLEALIKSKELEKQVDNADIEDPANLEIDFPRADEADPKTWPVFPPEHPTQISGAQV